MFFWKPEDKSDIERISKEFHVSEKEVKKLSKEERSKALDLCDATVLCRIVGTEGELD